MASLGRLVAGVAHELNNPISFIIGNVHALRRYAERLGQYLAAVHEGVPAEEIEQLRKRLRIDRILVDLDPLIEGTIEGAERTREIVDGLKRFSAVDRDEQQRFDLAEVIERAVRWVCQAERKSFKVATEFSGPLPVIGSAGQMQQVAMNLVQNAADATRLTELPTLRISSEQVSTAQGARILLRFEDNGPGITPVHLAHVFDPFFTTKPVGQGTGLALSSGMAGRCGPKTCLRAVRHSRSNCRLRADASATRSGKSVTGLGCAPPAAHPVWRKKGSGLPAGSGGACWHASCINR